MHGHQEPGHHDVVRQALGPRGSRLDASGVGFSDGAGVLTVPA